MNALFIYGTLAPGQENAHIMDGMNGTWKKASVHGHRAQSGWGVHKGHPGLIPDSSGPAVQGLVFISDDLTAHWARLDAFEGEDYKRVGILATLSNGGTIKAQIYSVLPPA